MPAELHALLRSFRKPLLAALILTQILFCSLARTRSLAAQVDLRAFYTAAFLVRTGHAAELYRYAVQQSTQQYLFGAGQTLPFLYPAFAALPFVPLSLLPYRVAFLALLLLNLALLASAAALLSRVARPQQHPLLLAACFVAFFPTCIALMQGQISFALLGLYSATALLLHRKRSFTAGLCLALALAKFQIALPIALLYLLWRQYRVVLGFCCGASVLGGLSLALTGWRGVQEYAAAMLGLGANTWLDPTLAHARYGMTVADMPNLHGIAASLTTNPHLVAAFTLISSVLVLALTSRCRPSLTKALPAALLVSYHLQPYDLVLLLVPLTLASGSRPNLHRATAALLLFPIAPWLLVQGETRWFLFGTVLMWLAAALPEAVADTAPHTPSAHTARALGPVLQTAARPGT